MSASDSERPVNDRRMNDKGYLRFHCLAVGLLFVAQAAYLTERPELAAAAMLVLAGLVAALRVGRLDVREKLILLTIYAYPTSFISFTGATYRDLPISFFNIAFMALLAFLAAHALMSGRVRPDRLGFAAFLCTASLMFGIVMSYSSSVSSAAWLSTLLTMSIYLALPLSVTGNAFGREGGDPLFLLDAFGFTMTAVAATVILQAAVFELGVALPGVQVLPSRTAFVALLSDRSQASVALAAGAAILLLRGTDKAAVRLSPALVLTAALGCILASGLTSARAGIGALVLCGIALVLTGRIRVSRIVTAGLVGVPAGWVAALLITWRRTLIDDSFWNAYYRIPLLETWVDVVWDRGPIAMVTGLGLGSTNHGLAAPGAFTPHNLVAEAFLDGGVWALAFLFLPVALTVAHWKTPVYLAGLWVIVAGAMVSPSMLESRFFPVYLVVGLVVFWRRRSGSVVAAGSPVRRARPWSFGGHDGAVYPSEYRRGL